MGGSRVEALQPGAQVLWDECRVLVEFLARRRQPLALQIELLLLLANCLGLRAQSDLLRVAERFVPRLKLLPLGHAFGLGRRGCLLQLLVCDLQLLKLDGKQ
jgi:hypothetical protein